MLRLNLYDFWFDPEKQFGTQNPSKRCFFYFSRQFFSGKINNRTVGNMREKSYYTRYTCPSNCREKSYYTRYTCPSNCMENFKNLGGVAIRVKSFRNDD